MSHLDELRVAYASYPVPNAARYVEALKQALQERDSRIAAWQDVWTTTAAERDAARAEVTHLEAENERLKALLADIAERADYGFKADSPLIAERALRDINEWCVHYELLAHQDQEPTP